MSWSVTFIGNPQKIVQALKDNSEKLSGVSKDEFDAALPHLIGLVEQNYNTYQEPVIHLTANGHGQQDKYCNCLVSIQLLGGIIV